MKIGIISDSHKKTGRQRKAIEHLLKEGAEFFIHAGDILKEENLSMFDEFNLKYVSIFGNNDHHLIEAMNRYNIYQEPYYFKKGSIKFKLMHLPLYLNPDTDIIIFGHTHFYECEYKNSTLYLNPGEVCARNRPFSSAVLLEVNNDSYIVNHFNREIKTNKWENEKNIFMRN